VAVVDVREAARAAVEESRDRLLSLSHRIHAHPELGFEEVRACAWLAEELHAAGLEVTVGVGDLPTAFVAEAGDGPLTIAVCAEYDALPEVGHACGHNVIATAAVGAGLALARVAGDVGIRVRVIGTPAEEGGGGKILLLERGLFDGAHAAMMVHPFPYERDHMPCLAVAHLGVEYTGRAAHASVHPEDGINAADALTVAQVAIGLLRQHLRENDRVHGIVTLGGGAPNVVPAHTTGQWYARSATLAELAELEPRVRACFEAGALATGCELTYHPDARPYSEFRVDHGLAAVYRRNAEQLGRRFVEPGGPADRMLGSTDMANISLALPSIHPMLDIDAQGSSNHQPEFAAHCVRPAADRAALDGAIAMAWTAIDTALDPDTSARLRGGA
jgi:amidohydrolase